MSANEIVNAIRAQFVMTAANPPVLLRSVGVVQASLTRTAAGSYTVRLEQPTGQGSMALDNVGVSCSTSDGSGPVACFAAAVPAVISAEGGIFVTARSLAGALADTGAFITVTVWTFPTLS